MYTPIMIANTIVRNHPGRFDIQQIAKLVQIIQGWGLEGGKGIVCESPVAWEYGPMHESLYVACRHSGLMTARQKLDAPIVPPLGTMAPLVPSEDSWTNALISQVITLYGNLTGIQLSSMLNRKGTPWHEVYGAFPRLRGKLHGKPISDDVLMRHYQRLRADSKIISAHAA